MYINFPPMATPQKNSHFANFAPENGGGKGESYWKPAFVGSMLVFWGVTFKLFGGSHIDLYMKTTFQLPSFELLQSGPLPVVNGATRMSMVLSKWIITPI